MELNLNNFQNDVNGYIEYLKEKTLYFEKLANDENFLFEQINNIEPTHIDFLIDFYKNASGPVNILRLFILKAVKSGIKINQNYVQEVKSNIRFKTLSFFENILDSTTIQYINSYKTSGNKDPFKSWKANFAIFYVYFYNGEIKNNTKKYLEEIGQNLLYELKLDDYTTRIVDFDGCRAQGQTSVWVALYPKRLKSYNNSVQLFCDINHGIMTAGIYKGSNVTTNIQLDDETRKSQYDNFFAAIEGLKTRLETAIKLNNTISDEDVENGTVKNKDFCLKIEDIFMNNQQSKQPNIIPLNQILYGPPGTGKTYNTVVEAIKILDYGLYLEYENLETSKKQNFYKNRLVPEFNRLKNEEKRIEFVTFHQSYSYEEFVEGIKPVLKKNNDLEEDKNQQISYECKDGIFKEICEHAKPVVTSAVRRAPIDFTKTRIFKMSLGANWENETEDIYNYCLTNNVVALGWGKDKDFSSCNTYEDFKKIDTTWGAKAVEIFKNWMRIGDIILISNGNSNIKAIAQITGEYEYHNDKEIRYCQFRNVEWLYNGDDISVSKFYDKKLSQQAIYGFYYKDREGKEDYNSTINTNVLNEIITGNINSTEEKPYVLIIDEINRGNISKIFGELITLIEEDKRGSLSVKLPYSQDPFIVPKNLYILGTMNTSDRSIASIDIALRRRFKFKEMMPDVNLVPDKIKIFGIGLQEIFTTLNERISILLDRDHQIGHSYFMKINDETDFKRVWFDNVLPLLNEYFYGDWEKLCALLGDFQPDGKSFIKKINNVKFANSYSCDEDETYDFVQESEIKFDVALKNAFSPSTKNKNSVENTTTEE